MCLRENLICQRTFHHIQMMWIKDLVHQIWVITTSQTFIGSMLSDAEFDDYFRYVVYSTHLFCVCCWWWCCFCCYGWFLSVHIIQCDWSIRDKLRWNEINYENEELTTWQCSDSYIYRTMIHEFLVCVYVSFFNSEVIHRCAFYRDYIWCSR